MHPTPEPVNVRAALTGKRILLTGSTGFLAKAVLEKLIRAVPGIGGITLLIRAGNGKASARERFDLEVATSSIFDRLRAEQPAWLERFFTERIECVTGEVTEEGFGLPAARFAELASRIDVVINAAASVDFREPLDHALAINALSPRHLGAFARAAGAPLVQVSTCYVNGYHTGEITERTLPPACAALPRLHDSCHDVEALIVRLQAEIGRIVTATPDAQRRARRLTDLGIREANRHGWNDTYTFTKWLGEQLALRAMQGRTLTIVRPSIIESTLQEPAPGWIEGVKVADAVILAYARGKTSFFPAKTDGIIDIIPADLVANSIVLAAAEALAEPGRHRIYQCSSGLGNPLRVGELIDLLQGECKRNWRAYDRLFHAEPKQDFRVVGHATFRLVMGAMRFGAAAWSGARRLAGFGEPKSLEKLRTTQLLALTFSFYTQPRYRFHNTGLLALAERCDAEERALFPVDARRIDWCSYLCRIHLAGLNRYALRRRDSAPVADATEVQPVAVETVR